MKTDATPAAILVGIVAVICCAGPLLIAAFGVSALAGWLLKSAYVLIPALLIALGVASFWFYRRRAGAINCNQLSRERSAKS